MKPFIRLGALAALAATVQLCLAEELEGTAYSVLFRLELPSAPGNNRGIFSFPAPQRGSVPARPGGNYSLAVGNRVIAQSAYDPQLKGVFFRLPMNLDLPDGPICLVLKDGRGQSMPVRAERSGDDGYAFRNPLWEKEYARLNDLNRSRAELRALMRDRNDAQKEIETVAPATTDGGKCVEPPMKSEPPRPDLAIGADDAAKAAGGICAWKWAQRLNSLPMTERLYRDAGLAVEWEARAQTEAVANTFTTLKINIGDDELERVKAAAIKGPGYLEHQEGIQRIKDRAAACRADVSRIAASTNQRWEADRLAVRNAPALAVQQCLARQNRTKVVEKQVQDGATRETELRKLIAKLESQEPSASESTRVDRAACKEF